MPKVAVCVFGCITMPKYCLQVLKIQETWGKRAEETHGVPVYYFLGEERLPGLNHPELWRPSTRLVFLPGVGNDYQSASFKQNLGIKYILDHHPEVEFVFACGTDTFLNIDALLRLLTFMNPDEKLYIGGHYGTIPLKNLPDIATQYNDNICSASYQDALRHDEVVSPASSPNADGLRSVAFGSNSLRFTKDKVGAEVYFHLGGAGFVLSRGILKELYPRLESMTEPWIESCKKMDKEQYTGACDVCIAYHAQLLGAKVVEYYYRFYECNHNGIIDISKMYGYSRYYPCCQNHLRISNVVSAHNMSLGDFDHFFRILNENEWFC
jgi:Fringe-like